MNQFAIKMLANYAVAVCENGLKNLKSNENAGQLMADRHFGVGLPLQASQAAYSLMSTP